MDVLQPHLGRAALQSRSTQINDQNAGQLGLAWYADLNTYRGVQATPLFIDGVLYNVSVWNVVTAYDGRTRARRSGPTTPRSRPNGRASRAAALPRAASRRGTARSTSARSMGG